MVRLAPRPTAVAGLLLATILAGCASDGYYRQSISGHLQLMSQRQDIAELIADEATPADLRRRLAIVTEALQYAGDNLALPDNGSYRSFVDLGRPYVIWNVVAAPALSLDPVRWCFPVVGCVSYRGYFDPADAIAFAEGLVAEGNDVAVVGARAYSTLGWFDDPLPSTIVFDADYDLVGTIFHELAHQRVFVTGDSTFNESYAVAVERAAVEMWLAENGTPSLRAAYERDRRRQEQFLGLVLGARAELVALYRSELDEADMLMQQQIFDRLRADYARLRESWGGYPGYDAWFSQNLNNAKLALVATYNSGVTAFQQFLTENGGDWEAFHVAVEAIAKLPEPERDAALARLTAEAD